MGHGIDGGFDSAHRLTSRLGRRTLAVAVAALTGVGVGGAAAMANPSSSNPIGIEPPRPPICDVADCNPIGPLGDRVIWLVNDTVDRGEAEVQRVLEQNPIGIELPRPPICDVADCNPIGPIGDPSERGGLLP